MFSVNRRFCFMLHDELKCTKATGGTTHLACNKLKSCFARSPKCINDSRLTSKFQGKYFNFFPKVDDNEKALRETQTLRAGCSKAEPKNFRPAADPFPGAQDGQN